MERRHQQRSRGSLARNIAQGNNQAAILTLNKIVIISADLVAGEADALEFVTGHHRRRCWLKALLNLHCQLQLTLQAFLLKSRFDQSRILDANSRDRSQGRQHLEMIFSKPSLCDW